MKLPEDAQFPHVLQMLQCTMVQAEVKDDGVCLSNQEEMLVEPFCGCKVP